MNTKSSVCLSVIICAQVIIGHPAFAQVNPPSINAIPLPVGSGARALGMGGAFIAVADDATAASWNPGGLTQLERPELSIVGAFLATEKDFDPGNTSFTLGNETVSSGDVNYASMVYPFKIFGKNLVAALNYQQVYDFHTNYDFDMVINSAKTGLNLTERVDFESRGGIGALTPAFSFQVTPKLSVGMSANIYTDEFFGDYGWKEIEKGRGTGSRKGTDITVAYDSENTFKNFQAVNITTGLLWNIWEKENKSLTFGAVYDTPYTAQVDKIRDGTTFITPFYSKPEPFHERLHYKMDYPMSFGAGFGFRYNDALSFSTDVTWTDWSSYMQKDEKGKESRPIGGVSEKRGIDDTYSVRYGTEYLLFQQNAIIPLRGGLFYEPRPSLDNPTDVYGLSVGSGITFKRVSIDGAYQFRWSNNIDGEDIGLKGTQFDTKEHLFLASLIVYF